MPSIVIFGAGGRAGRAVTTEALRRGHSVTAVVREPARHPDLPAAIRGDVTDPRSVAEAVAGHDAAVHAVSPASGPAALAELDLDPDFFRRAADALLRSGVARLVVIGLFANLLDDSGRPLLDDPDVLPAEFRPFALAHAAGLHHLRGAATATDWAMLTPPALLEVDAPRLGRYRLGGETAPAGRLSYADLAVAVVDEVERPTLHRTRASVFN
ncbi:NAD(P)-dependent oxidoreductase [Micromonospora sp. NBS 11-29]|uniref:NAD(P)-dependent oxidoreductase n=1 Tax=Micromonospora sp. NBS 11-29 TaxID=1960879 RepID=UPI000B781367|nr:NAD(P)H-binding protein [Micromonospora sp. NBS 11-29]